MYNIYNQGWIEVVCGPMFAGKTEELIRRIKRLEIANQKVLVFNPKVDTRYSNTQIVAHSKLSHDAIFVENSKDILKYIKNNINCVVIDEAQFFDFDIVKIVDYLADLGIRVIVGGLDTDFRGEPFGPMPYLLAKAEFVTKLTAICPVTKRPATRTQRLVNGLPANYTDEQFLLGAKESYEPRSRQAHDVPNKPKLFGNTTK